MSETVDCGAYYLYRDGKSPFWQLRATDSKKGELWKSTKTPDLAKAKVRAKELFTVWTRTDGLIDAEAEEIQFIDLWNEYVAFKSTSITPKTEQKIRRIGEMHLLPYFAYKSLTEVPKLWPRWLITMKRQRPKSDLHNEIKYLVGAFQYAYDRDYISRVPTIKRPKAKKKRFKKYDAGEIASILTAVYHDEKTRIYVLMGYTMGMRSHEVAYLPLDKIDLEKQTVDLSATKYGTRPRIIKISPEVFPLLKRRVLALRGKSPWLYPQIRNSMAYEKTAVRDVAWQRVKAVARVKGRYHDLRHTCASMLAKSSVPPSVAAAYLGMSLKTFDETYCHLDEDDTEVASQAIEAPLPKLNKRGQDVET